MNEPVIGQNMPERMQDIPPQLLSFFVSDSAPAREAMIIATNDLYVSDRVPYETLIAVAAATSPMHASLALVDHMLAALKPNTEHATGATETQKE